MELINSFPFSRRRVGSNDLYGMLNETPREKHGRCLVFSVGTRLSDHMQYIDSVFC